MSSLRPALPSDPPPPKTTDSEVRPMSPMAAVGWGIGSTVLFAWLVTLTATLREAARWDLVNNFACQLLAMLAALFLILRIYAPDASIRRVLGVRPSHPGFYPLAISLGVAMALPTNVLYELILRRFPNPNADDGLARMFSETTTPKRVVMGLIVVALGPLVEEVFFRGALFSPQRRRSTAPVVVVVTAALFAVAHVEIQRFLPIFLLGIAMGTLRAASGSLFPSMLMHATFNAVPFYAMTRPGAALEEAPAGPLPLGLATASVAVAVALVCGVALLGARSVDAARAREKDRA